MQWRLFWRELMPPLIIIEPLNNLSQHLTLRIIMLGDQMVEWYYSRIAEMKWQSVRVLVGCIRLDNSKTQWTKSTEGEIHKCNYGYLVNIQMQKGTANLCIRISTDGKEINWKLFYLKMITVVWKKIIIANLRKERGFFSFRAHNTERLSWCFGLRIFPVPALLFVLLQVFITSSCRQLDLF